MPITKINSPKEHAYIDPRAPQQPEPTYAERVRTMVSLGSIATLSTVSRKRSGYPFGSLMPYAIDGIGQPILLISNMAMHTQNLREDPRASLFVGQAGDGDPLGTARATLIGDVLPVPREKVGEARERYLSRKVDPLAEAAPTILGHMNADHVPAMIVLARVHAGLNATEATMTAVDRLGFHLRLKTSEGMKGVRINFLHEVQNANETRAVLVEMVRAAEAKT